MCMSMFIHIYIYINTWIDLDIPQVCRTLADARPAGPAQHSDRLAVIDGVVG